MRDNDGYESLDEVLFPLGAFRPIFRGKLAVSFRECNFPSQLSKWNFNSKT